MDDSIIFCLTLSPINAIIHIVSDKTTAFSYLTSVGILNNDCAPLQYKLLQKLCQLYAALLLFSSRYCKLIHVRLISLYPCVFVSISD